MRDERLAYPWALDVYRCKHMSAMARYIEVSDINLRIPACLASRPPLLMPMPVDADAGLCVWQLRSAAARGHQRPAPASATTDGGP